MVDSPTAKRGCVSPSKRRTLTPCLARIAAIIEPDMPLPNAGTQPIAYARARDVHDQRTDLHALDVLARFGELASEAGVAFTGRHVCTDRVDAAIVDVARDLECDMIVMTTHGRGAFGDLLFGSHTKNVLAKSKLPLLVLH